MLTDIEGSTNLHELYPDEMFDIMETHDEIVLNAIESCGGEQFKHTGDGAWAVFAQPLQAVSAAIKIQTEIAAIRLNQTRELIIRIGISSGQARRRRDDYFGPALNVTARLEGAASGKQILLGDTTHELLGIDHPSEIGFEHLGEHRFKGIQPMGVFQVLAPGLASEFDPIGGKREAPEGNLPAELSSFIGRGREIEEVAQLAMANRVTTLLGPGGIGKTRLSIKAAQSLDSAFADGKFLIDLSPVERGQDVWPAFTAAFLIPPVADTTPRAQVLDRLSSSDALLVVDNCEHVLEEVSDAITEIVTSTPVQVLATSRHVLNIPGEAIYDLDPLHEASNDDSALTPAVQLFVDRGKLVARNFDPTEEDLKKVAVICEQLDHLPLGIEIAAANLRRLNLDQIHQRASDPMALRAARHRRAVGRQQTLRETLEWSYALIDPAFTQILDTLCVFSGAFVSEAAEDLCTSLGVDEDDFADAMDELLDSSLLANDPSSPDRFRILQTVRAFGRERLEEQSRREEADDAHGHMCARRIKALCDQYDSAEEREAATVLLGELPDMRAAFERAVEDDIDLAAKLTAPLFFFNYVHRGAEYGNWPARLLACDGSDDLLQAPVVCAAAAAKALHADGNPEAAMDYVRRGNAALERGAKDCGGWLPGVAGQVAFWSDDYAMSLEHHKTAAAIAAQEGNKTCQVVSLSLAAIAAARFGKPKQATQMADEALAATDEASNPSAIGYAFFAKGMLETRRNPKLALEFLESANEWADVGGNHQGANRVLRIIADVKAAHEKPENALLIQAKALLNFPERGDAIHSWSCIESIFKPLFALERYEEVAILAGALDNSPITIDRNTELLIENSLERLGEENFAASRAYGSSLGLFDLRAHVAESYLGPAWAEGR